jgi:hypothetical protein
MTIRYDEHLRFCRLSLRFHSIGISYIWPLLRVRVYFIVFVALSSDVLLTTFIILYFSLVFWLQALQNNREWRFWPGSFGFQLHLCILINFGEGHHLILHIIVSFHSLPFPIHEHMIPMNGSTYFHASDTWERMPTFGSDAYIYAVNIYEPAILSWLAGCYSRPIRSLHRSPDDPRCSQAPVMNRPGFLSPRPHWASYRPWLRGIPPSPTRFYSLSIFHDYRMSMKPRWGLYSLMGLPPRSLDVHEWLYISASLYFILPEDRESL